MTTPCSYGLASPHPCPTDAEWEVTTKAVDGSPGRTFDLCQVHVDLFITHYPGIIRDVADLTGGGRSYQSSPRVGGVVSAEDVLTLRAIYERLRKFHSEWSTREDDPEDMFIEAPEMALKCLSLMKPILARLEGKDA